MNEKRFGYGETDLFEWITLDGEMISTKECVDKLNELYDENEQLRKELDNFKPVMFQDVRKGTVILYSKGDLDE